MRYSERAFKVSGHIPFGASCGNGITEDLAANGAHPLGGFVTAPRFDRTKHRQQFVRGYVGNWATVKDRCDEAD
jgi:hypothetical protein